MKVGLQFSIYVCLNRLISANYHQIILFLASRVDKVGVSTGILCPTSCTVDLKIRTIWFCRNIYKHTSFNHFWFFSCESPSQLASVFQRSFEINTRFGIWHRIEHINIRQPVKRRIVEISALGIWFFKFETSKCTNEMFQVFNWISEFRSSMLFFNTYVVTKLYDFVFFDFFWIYVEIKNHAKVSNFKFSKQHFLWGYRDTARGYVFPRHDVWIRWPNKTNNPFSVFTAYIRILCATAVTLPHPVSSTFRKPNPFAI